MALLSPSRIQLIHVTLLESPEFSFECCPTLNPAILIPNFSEPPIHTCNETLEDLIPHFSHISSALFNNPDLTWYISIPPNNQTFHITLIHNQPKQAIQFILLLISLGRAAGIATGTAGFTTSVNYYHSLSGYYWEPRSSCWPYHSPGPTRFPDSCGPSNQKRIRPSHSRKRRPLSFHRRSLLLLRQ